MVKCDYAFRKVQGIVGEYSFSIVLPKSFAHDLRISKGDYVKVTQEDGRIIIQKMNGEEKQ
ncbi:MAG: AbrB/MazE/SpoVT family DNA-binding domain-containing protein [Nitrososphaeraceae archaeon]